jgi:hypothetical protein
MTHAYTHIDSYFRALNNNVYWGTNGTLLGLGRIDLWRMLLIPFEYCYLLSRVNALLDPYNT